MSQLLISTRYDIYMSKIEIKVLGGYVAFLLIILLFVSFTGCESGWSLMGWDVK
jgi:hypothetical protein